MSRHVMVSLDDILDTVVSIDESECYSDHILSDLGQWTGEVTDEELESFLNWYASSEALKRGFSEEDADLAREVVYRWRNTYAMGKTI